VWGWGAHLGANADETRAKRGAAVCAAGGATKG
jgi:hypothetical protein